MSDLMYICENCKYRAECERDDEYICPADEDDEMWLITQGDRP